MRRYALICFLASVGINAVAAADLQSLLSKPPFDTVSSGTTSPAGPSGPIEFRGILKEGQRWSFCLYNVQAKSSMWVGLQESGQTYFVKSYDAAKETVQVEFSQSTYTLPLRIATTPTTAPASTAMGPVPGRTTNPLTGGPIPVPTPGASGSGPTVIGEGSGPETGGTRDMRNLERLAREAARLRAERARNLNSAPTPKQ